MPEVDAEAPCHVGEQCRRGIGRLVVVAAPGVLLRQGEDSVYRDVRQHLVAAIRPDDEQ